MPTFHVVVFTIVLFILYLVGMFVFYPAYAHASAGQLLVGEIRLIAWTCVGLCLTITLDFTRKATVATNCKQVHGNLVLWVITLALILQLILAANVAIMIVTGSAANVISALKGHEVAVVTGVLAGTVINSLAYAVTVDANS